MIKIIHTIEGLSQWVGKAFGWCILILTLSVSYEVFVRYVLNAPTVWAFDMMVQMYGALFLMAKGKIPYDAEAAAKQVLQLAPSFTLESFRRTQPYRDEADWRRYADALRAAGLP